MRRYQTEVVIPASRYIGLQLPSQLPEGRATVIIRVDEDDPAVLDTADDEFDRDDIEWWDEFGDDAEEADEPRASRRIG